MSDKIIKINSVQGFAESWGPNASPTTLDLVDFVIPRGLTVDLSKSYVAFNVETFQNQANVCNVDLFVDVEQDQSYNTPSAALFRNASIACDKGQIENIRRLDTLSCGLWAMSNDAETQKGDLNMFGAFTDERGEGNKTSMLLDCVVDNTNPDGTSDGRVSKQIARDIKIPIKDMFGIGMAEDWSTDIFGETRIHCETNFKKLQTRKLGGNEDTLNSFDGTTPWGACEALANQPAATALTELTLSVDYINLDHNLTCPFFCGQALEFTAASADTAAGIPGAVLTSTLAGGGTTGYTTGQTGAFTGGTGTGATFSVTTATAGVITAYTIVDEGQDYTAADTLTFAGGDGTATATVNTVAINVAATGNAIISQIERQAGATEFLKLTFATPIHTVGATPQWLSSILLKAQNTQLDSIAVNRAELVLFTVDEPNPSDSFKYSTYLTELDNGNGLINLHRQYIVEPECQNLLVAQCLDTLILPAQPYVSYRMAIDNEDITGNRSVEVGSPLQFDRLNRCLNSNSNIEWKNAQMKFYSSHGTQLQSYAKDISMICETMPLTSTNKKVSLEIDATGGTVQSIILYKQIEKTI
tara:strand:- start:508 stop:2265 length:1758 start_codon:yes stop_codon:yes gene_type:complete